MNTTHLAIALSDDRDKLLLLVIAHSIALRCLFLSNFFTLNSCYILVDVAHDVHLV